VKNIIFSKYRQINPYSRVFSRTQDSNEILKSQIIIPAEVKANFLPQKQTFSCSRTRSHEIGGFEYLYLPSIFILFFCLLSPLPLRIIFFVLITSRSERTLKIDKSSTERIENNTKTK
jgi:hypothetical protein